MEPIIAHSLSITPLQKWAFLDSRPLRKEDTGTFSLMLTNMSVIEPG